MRQRKITGTYPLWYKDAIFYEVRVRSFYDSDGDGIGDFRGLTMKLDYFQALGVSTLWLLRSILRRYGTTAMTSRTIPRFMPTAVR